MDEPRIYFYGKSLGGAVIAQYMIDAGWCGSGWYWWDASWSRCYGPYETREQAAAALLDEI